MRFSKFISQISQKKIFWIVVSFAASFMLWLYVTSTEGVTIEKNFNGVKVVLVGENELRDSAGLVVTEQNYDTINLTLSGTRRSIGNISSSDLSVQVNLSDVKTDGNFTKLYEISYPDNVKSDDITLVKASVNSIQIKVERYISKTVEVKGEFTGSTADGYLADDSLIFDPMAVKVSGPKSAVEKINDAYVQITRENVDASISYPTTYELRDADGNTIDTSSLVLDTDEVNVTLNVLLTKTVSLKVSVVEGGGATEQNSVITVTPSSIILAGKAETLNAINQIVIETVKLSEVNESKDIPDVVIPIPNDTENLTGISTASIHVEIQNLVTDSYTVDSKSMTCINLADGLSADILTDSLPILIRSNEEDLSTIDAKNIRVSVDLTDYTAGIYTVPVKITVDGHPDAGAVGDYKVYVHIT